jgi:hypothetical protein
VLFGVKTFGPPGSRRGAFSVGWTDADGDVVVVVVVVVVEVSGAFSSSLAHDAVKKPIAEMAAMPATVPTRRSKRLSEVMLHMVSDNYLGNSRR